MKKQDEGLEKRKEKERKEKTSHRRRIKEEQRPSATWQNPWWPHGYTISIQPQWRVVYATIDRARLCVLSARWSTRSTNSANLLCWYDIRRRNQWTPIHGLFECPGFEPFWFDPWLWSSFSLSLGNHLLVMTSCQEPSQEPSCSPEAQGKSRLCPHRNGLAVLVAIFIWVMSKMMSIRNWIASFHTMGKYLEGRLLLRIKCCGSW